MVTRAITNPGGRAAIRYGWHDRFKIPLEHPSALRFYLHNLFVPHSRREMLWGTLARVSAPAGRAALPLLGVKAAGRLKGERAGEGVGAEAHEAGGAAPDVLTERLAARLREAGVSLAREVSAITLDDYRHSAREKVVVFLFERGAQLPRLVAKASRNPAHRAALAQEHATLEALRARLGEGLTRTLPEPLAAVEDGGLAAFAEAYVPGRSVYFEMRNGWLPRRRAAEHFRLALAWLAEFQKETRAGEASLAGEVLAENVVKPLRAYQRACSPSAEERTFIAGVLRRAEGLRGERFPLVARQGDFWARNLLVCGGRLCVLDWEHYAERAAPFEDLFLFATSYALSYPWRLGRWAEPAAALRAAFKGTGWMARLVRRSLLGHCAGLGVRPALLEVFFPAFLAARAAEEKGRGGGGKGARRKSRADSAEGSGTWGSLFQEYARTGGAACFGSSTR
ncbi:MAG TPA: hypothetical protein VF591_15495 [Pyrinomonadaceae bacterium]|jgi:hypothetical protein